jgi:hypothetical protein
LLVCSASTILIKLQNFVANTKHPYLNIGWTMRRPICRNHCN